MRPPALQATHHLGLKAERLNHTFMLSGIVLFTALSLPIDGTDWAAQFGPWTAGDWLVLCTLGSVCYVYSATAMQVSGVLDTDSLVRLGQLPRVGLFVITSLAVRLSLAHRFLTLGLTIPPPTPPPPPPPHPTPTHTRTAALQRCMWQPSGIASALVSACD